jgi:hypothetical protein
MMLIIGRGITLLGDKLMPLHLPRLAASGVGFL